MATMLAFVFTDAALSPGALASPGERSRRAQTFNCISVEGHTSTNDTLLVLANGLVQNASLLSGERLARLPAGQDRRCAATCQREPSRSDAEGATHLVTIDVEGMRNDAEAHRVAKAIAESALVKTALYGADPNWGRIVSAAGYSGMAFAEEDLSLWLGETLLYDKGAPLPFDAAAVSAYLKGEREIHMRLRFTLGTGRCRFWTCDLTEEYIKLNADYTT